MDLNNKAYNQLIDTFKNNRKVTITGCNGFGCKFETTGRVAAILGSELDDSFDPDILYPALLDHCIYLDCGVIKNDIVRTDYVAPFFLTLDDFSLNYLFVNEIKDKKTGKLIFKNKDYEEYFNLSRENLIGYGCAYLSLNRTPFNMDRFCQKINNCIGKPINIYGNAGILYLAEILDNKEVVVHYYTFEDPKILKIPKTSTITESKFITKITEPENTYSFQDFLIFCAILSNT